MFSHTSEAVCDRVQYPYGRPNVQLGLCFHPGVKLCRRKASTTTLSFLLWRLILAVILLIQLPLVSASTWAVRHYVLHRILTDLTVLLHHMTLVRANKSLAVRVIFDFVALHLWE